MKLMLVKGERQRVPRCVDCDLPDPLQNPETHSWLKGELSTGKFAKRTSDGPKVRS
jgi:hypothetical protein